MPTTFSNTPVTFGRSGTTSTFVGLMPSTPRIGRSIVSFAARGVCVGRLTLRSPGRVSSTRDGVVGINRAPGSADEVGNVLVENHPKTSTTTCAVPLWPNRPIVRSPSTPGRTMATLGTVSFGPKLTIDVRFSGFDPLPYASR
jgi:hypothetical protein